MKPFPNALTLGLWRLSEDVIITCDDDNPIQCDYQEDGELRLVVEDGMLMVERPEPPKANICGPVISSGSGIAIGMITGGSVTIAGGRIETSHRADAAADHHLRAERYIHRSVWLLRYRHYQWCRRRSEHAQEPQGLR